VGIERGGSFQQSTKDRREESGVSVGPHPSRRGKKALTRSISHLMKVLEGKRVSSKRRGWGETWGLRKGRGLEWAGLRVYEWAGLWAGAGLGKAGGLLPLSSPGAPGRQGHGVSCHRAPCPR
jgi:hypothetical protein